MSSIFLVQGDLVALEKETIVPAQMTSVDGKYGTLNRGEKYTGVSQSQFRLEETPAELDLIELFSGGLPHRAPIEEQNDVAMYYAKLLMVGTLVVSLVMNTIK